MEKLRAASATANLMRSFFTAFPFEKTRESAPCYCSGANCSSDTDEKSPSVGVKLQLNCGTGVRNLDLPIQVDLIRYGFSFGFAESCTDGVSHSGRFMVLSNILDIERPFSGWPWRIRNPMEVLELVSMFSGYSHEAMLALYVTSELDLLSIDIVGKGSVNQVKVDYREVLARASQLGAGAFFLVHNHPSGDPTPSEADISYTVEMRRLSYQLELPLLDHFIVTGTQMRRVGLGILGEVGEIWTLPGKSDD